MCSKNSLRETGLWGRGFLFQRVQPVVAFPVYWEEHHDGKEPGIDSGCSHHGGPGNGEQDLK